MTTSPPSTLPEICTTVVVVPHLVHHVLARSRLGVSAPNVPHRRAASIVNGDPSVIGAPQSLQLEFDRPA